MVVSTFFATILVDKVGRLPLLLISSSLMALSLGALSFFASPDSDFNQWLPVVCVGSYIFAFSVGFGPLPWMMMGELFSPRAKYAGSALAACVSWFLAFVVTFFFPILANHLEEIPVILFSTGVCVGAFFFVICVVPETKAKSIEEIQQNLNTHRANIGGGF
jgi:MFS family permease